MRAVHLGPRVHASFVLVATLTLAAILVFATEPARAAALTCQGKTATHVGTAGPDTIVGTPGNDVISGRGGDDLIKGLAGDDIVCGGAGKDVILGGSGRDALRGGPGADTLKGGASADVLKGGSGRDTLIGNAGPDTLNGGKGTDTASGGGGSDKCAASEYTVGCETRPGCHDSYPGVCIPPPPPDLNCGDVPYTNFTVIGSDPHGFDGNKDGTACEG